MAQPKPKKIKVIVAGVKGRMSRHLLQLLAEEPDLELVGGTLAPGDPDAGQEITRLMGLPFSHAPAVGNLEEILGQGDVVIDFTVPQASLANLRLASAHSVPMVLGTTGFKPTELEEICSLASRVAVVLSPNMSLMVNLLFRLTEEVAGVLGEEYDCEIVEAHHHFKRDAPSGTAKRLAEGVARSRGQELAKVSIYGREGVTGERPRGEIGVHALRAGDLVGEHTVIFAGPGERLELTHRAHSRDAFARGALRAARFVVQAKPGLYEMRDVLGLGSA